MKDKSCDIRVIEIDVGNKKIKEVVLIGDESGLADYYYRVGDVVEKYAGLKYPVNYSSPRAEIFCPVCGRFNKVGEEKCYVCKNKLTKAE